MRTPLVWLLALAACSAPERPAPLDLATLGEDFEARRHEIDWIDRPLLPTSNGAWQARSGGLRAYLLPDTTWLVDRRDRDPDWAIGLTAARYGRADALVELSSGVVSTSGRWFERAREGIVEWFHNRDDGLQHGFTLTHPPPGEGPLVLDVEVTGATAHALPDGAWLWTGRSRPIAWRDLVVFDADRRPLEARVAIAGSAIRLTIDDRGARWPVTIDPLLTQIEVTREVLEGPQPAIVAAIDVEGDVVLVGNPGTLATPGGAGAVYERNTGGGADEWDPLVTLTDPNGSAIQLGATVALGLPYAAVASAQSGEILVWRNEGTQWDLEATIPSVAGEFGAAMDLAYETLIVGAPGGGSLIDAGQVYVINRYGGGVADWSFDPQNVLEPGTPRQGARFGSAVRISGDRFVVGAPGADRAHVYRMTVGGSVAGEVEVLDGPAGTGFGTAVALEGDRAAIGAPGGNTVHVYERLTSTAVTSETWTEVAVVPAPIGAGANFGTTVALHADTLAVTDLPSAGGLAQVHLFERRGSGWGYVESLPAGIVADPPAPFPIALHDRILAVGKTLLGSFDVYRRDGARWIQVDEPGPAGAQAEFGAAVAASGRLVVIGAPSDDRFEPEAGSVELYGRDERGVWSFLDHWDAEDESGRAGHAVAIDGDLVLVGAPEDSRLGPTLPSHGVAYLLEYDGVGLGYRGADALVLEPPSSLGADRADLRFGEAVALDQLFAVIGTPGWSADRGSAQLHARNWPAPGAWGWLSAVGYGTHDNDEMGRSVAVAEGLFFAGSPLADGAAGTNVGAVEVWDLAALFTPAEIQRIEGSAAGAKLGKSLDVQGQLLAIGAFEANGGAGEVQLWQLANNGATWFAPLVTLPGSAGDNYGTDVALAGDHLYVGAAGNGFVDVRVRNEGGRDAWGVTTSFVNDAIALAASGDTLVVGDGGSADGAVHLLQLDAEHPPVARADVFVVDEDATLEVFAPTGLLANDHDPDGDPIDAIKTSDPSSGTVLVFGDDGSLEYRPDPNFHGLDTFQYYVEDEGFASSVATVTIDVRPVNDAPVVAPDGPFEVEEGTALDSATIAGGDVLANDSDIDGDPLTAVLIDPPAIGGTFVLRPDGTFTYDPPDDVEPPPGGKIETSFTYRADDGEAVSVGTALVQLEITPKNDPPETPTLQLERSALAEDVPWVEGPPGLLAGVTDPDGDPLTVVLLTNPTKGALRVEPNGAWSYTPHTDANGTDTFRFQVTDGQLSTAPIDVALDVAPVNDRPVATPDGPLRVDEDQVLTIDPDALVANDADVEDPSLLLDVVIDADPEHGTLAEIAGDLVYTPDPDFAGVDAFRYRARDQQSTTSVLAVEVELEVVAINDPPRVADDDFGEIAGPISENVLANDTDPEGDPFTAELLVPPRGGDVSLAPDGSFTYTPRAGFVGGDAFLYVARDGGGAASEPATVEVVVLPGPGTTTTGPGDTGCVATTWFHDADGDGFGDEGTAVEACAAPVGHVAEAGDCDDALAASWPGAVEVPGDGIDQDCDGLDNVARPAGACEGCAGTSAPGPLAALALLAFLRRRGAR